VKWPVQVCCPAIMFVFHFVSLSKNVIIGTVWRPRSNMLPTDPVYASNEDAAVNRRSRRFF